MADTQDRFDWLMTRLRESDYRLTPQRVELIRLIITSNDHPSASRLYNQIKTQFPTMSLATVYKTLDLLKELGEVLEIDLRDDSHYDGNHPEPHPHLICSKCNKIVDGDLDIDLGVLRKLERASGYTILRPQISFYGLCPDCKKES
jgi:Fur family peroxide stress response transcriptional regulator